MISYSKSVSCVNVHTCLSTMKGALTHVLPITMSLIAMINDEHKMQNITGTRRGRVSAYGVIDRRVDPSW